MKEITKKISTIVIILVGLLFYQNSYADTHMAASCSYTDVNNAVTASSTGDTVSVPSGSCDWGANYLTITKAIKLVGAGTSQTTGTRITGTGNTTYGFGIFKIDTGSTESTFPFEMTGFRVTSTIIGNKNMIRISGAGSGWRIHGNYFYKNATTEDAVLNVYPSSNTSHRLFGLIDNNVFENIKIYVTGTLPQANLSWMAPAQWGTDQAVFIENNTFIGPSPRYGLRIDSQLGARLVIRYNDFKDARLEVHGACQTTVRGARSSEIYNNNMMATNNPSEGLSLALRAGSHVIARNRIAGVYTYNGKVGVDNRRAWFDSACTSGFGNADGTSAYDTYNANPVHSGTASNINVIPLDGIGVGTGAIGSQTQDPVYVWNNIAGNVCISGTAKYGECDTSAGKTACVAGGGTCSTQANTPNSVHRRNDINNQLYQILANRDYYENTARPGWTPYACPHPLAGLTGSCDSAKVGTAGYNTKTQSTLFVTSVNGTVTSNPSGINCGSTCYANFDSEASVTLTALPNSGYTFTGWSGGGCSGTGTCSVDMKEARSVQANFAQSALYNLTVKKVNSNAGTVTSSDSLINCGSTCSANYGPGKAVTLTANPKNKNYRFHGWSGACSGTGTCTVAMTAAKSVTATFYWYTYWP